MKERKEERDSNELTKTSIRETCYCDLLIWNVKKIVQSYFIIARKRMTLLIPTSFIQRSFKVYSTPGKLDNFSVIRRS